MRDESQNLIDYYLLKESASHVFNQLGLHEEALIQLEEFFVQFQIELKAGHAQASFSNKSRRFPHAT